MIEVDGIDRNMVENIAENIARNMVGDTNSGDIISAQNQQPEDGIYMIEVTLEGGSGRATITSPAKLTVSEGEMTAEIEWSSEYYDYMIVAGETYLPVNTEGNSVFEIPVADLDQVMKVIGDTTAMSVPHEIEYTLNWDAATLVPADNEAGGDTSENPAGASAVSSGATLVSVVSAVAFVAVTAEVVAIVRRQKKEN